MENQDFIEGVSDEVFIAILNDQYNSPKKNAFTKLNLISLMLKYSGPDDRYCKWTKKEVLVKE